jgi:DNA-binding MarR family transcriptional regulator
MSDELGLLTEIRDLLQVMAEPQLAARDAKLRSALRGAVGKSPKRAKAVVMMDGTRTQKMVATDSGLDQGDVSRLVKALANQKLVSADLKHPKVLLKVPATFFEGNGDNE